MNGPGVMAGAQLARLTSLCGGSHAKNKFAGRSMPFSACNAYISVVAGKSRRYGMTPAHIPVFLSQKRSTQNGINRPAILFLAWTTLSGCSPAQVPCHAGLTCGVIVKRGALSRCVQAVCRLRAAGFLLRGLGGAINNNTVHPR